MNFDYLPMGTAVLAPQEFVSPLQQRLILGADKPGGAHSIGSPVRICNMTNRETKKFNGLVGDIVDVRKGQASKDGAAIMVFDIRCPLINSTLWWPKSVKDLDHGETTVSVLAHNSILNNRQILFGSQESSERRMEFAGVREPGSAGVGGPNSDVDETPYHLFTSITTEKFETLSSGGGEQRGKHAPLAPKWGVPASGGQQMQPMYMSQQGGYHHSMPYGGLPPMHMSQPGGYHHSMQQQHGMVMQGQVQPQSLGSLHGSLQSLPGSNVYAGPPRNPAGATMRHDGSLAPHA